jgi:hypothetical protein
VWGAVYLVAAAVLALSRTDLQIIAGHGLLGLLYLIWGLSLAYTVVVDTAAPWGSPVHVLAIAAIHLIALYRFRRAVTGSSASR